MLLALSRLTLLLITALGLLRASAHEVGLSTADVKCGADSIGVQIVLAVKDTETIFDLDPNHYNRVTTSELSANQEAIKRYLEQACVFRANGEKVAPSTIRSSVDESNNLELALSYPIREPATVTIEFALITDMQPGHRMFVSVWNSAGNLIAERLLTQAAPELRFSTGEAKGEGAPVKLPSFLGFIKLGVEHIGTGYDHLLFLFALLIVTRNFRSSIMVITCFTLAHSVTLAAATFNLVNLPSRITEPLIAATIVYVGVENIWRKGDPHGRWALTFGFGLVHGFGFASVLREMGVGAHGGGVALPLLGFNLGVEVGQLAVAAVLLPVIWKLRTTPVFVNRAVPACSALVALLGGYWLIQRLWG